MGSLGFIELLILVLLPLLGVIGAAFWLALAAFIKVRRLERKLAGLRDLSAPRT